MNNELDFEKWELAIGKIILAGSRVEYELIRLYETHFPERDYFSDGYLDRYDKAIGFAKKSMDSGFYISRNLIEMKKVAELRVAAVAKLPVPTSEPVDDAASSGESGKFCSSSTLRHLVAHNPIHYYPPDETWCIFDNKNQDQKITLQELESEAHRLWDLSLELSTLLRISV